MKLTKLILLLMKMLIQVFSIFLFCYSQHPRVFMVTNFTENYDRNKGSKFREDDPGEEEEHNRSFNPDLIPSHQVRRDNGTLFIFKLSTSLEGQPLIFMKIYISSSREATCN